MVGYVTVSCATEQAVRETKRKIDALERCIESAKIKPRVCKTLSTSLESLKIILSFVCGSGVTTSDITQKAEEVLCLNISGCTKACGELMKLVDRSKDRKVCEFDTTEEVQVELLSNELDQWKDLVHEAVNLYLKCSSLGSPPMSGNINQEQTDKFSTVENDLSNMISKVNRSDDKLNDILSMVNAQVTRIKPSQTLLLQLQSDVKRLRTRQGIYTEGGGEVMVGTSDGFTQNFKGIRAFGEGARGAVGTFGPGFNINEFFK